MGMMVYDIGDEVYYPYFTTDSGRKMKVIDRMPIWYSANKVFIRYLFDDTLMEYLVEDMKKNVANEYDNLVVIDGPEGSGKSTLAYQICKKYDPDFDMSTSYIYDYQEFLKAITDQDVDDRGRIFWMDEATNISSNRESMTYGGRKFIQLLEMMRSRGWTLVMCIPSVERLDVYIREHRIRYLLTAMEMAGWEERRDKSRGYFELKFKRTSSYRSFHTIGYGIFGMMSPEEKHLYNTIKKQSQQAKMDEIAGKHKETTKTNTRQERMTGRVADMAMMMVDMGMDPKKIAQDLDMNPDYVKDLVALGRRRKRERDDLNA